MNRLFQYFDSFVEKGCRTTRVVTSIFLFCMMLLVTIDVLGRSIIGKTTLVADEMSRYLLLAVVYFGLVLTQRAGKHIEVNLFNRWLSPRRRQQLGLITLIVTTLFIGWFAWLTFGAAKWNYAEHVTSLTLVRTPMWIPYLLVPLGLAMFTIQLLVDMIKRIKKPEEVANDNLKRQLL